jgi:hypothetical protein
MKLFDPAPRSMLEESILLSLPVSPFLVLTIMASSTMLTDATNYKTHLERYSDLNQEPFHGDYGVLMKLLDQEPRSML